MSTETTEETLKKAQKWCKREFAKRRVPGQHPSFVASEILKEADERFNLGGYGVEGWCNDVGSKGVDYINFGDVYSLTLVAVTGHNASFMVRSVESVAGFYRTSD